ncbi:MAG: pantetheine-phosphate adenylyltransferase [Bacteroidetes bacterium RIFCSPLOWO2_12_FULL_31_6]|nr:MAG: pantetheine-phosphate adenylyltransferase [Bacteroidetes bacterium RIFCSPLOWO2_12_FULL_31_6]
MKTTVFPGSFDPFTIGHESIVKRALPLFDQIIIAIGINADKTGFFSLEKRMQWIKDLYKKESKIKIDSYQGLTIDYCKKINAHFILRGLRTSADFEFERAIAQMNREMNNDIETIFLVSEPKHCAINSSIIRDIIRNGGDASQFVPFKI